MAVIHYNRGRKFFHRKTRKVKQALPVVVGLSMSLTGSSASKTLTDSIRKVGLEESRGDELVGSFKTVSKEGPPNHAGLSAQVAGVIPKVDNAWKRLINLRNVLEHTKSASKRMMSIGYRADVGMTGGGGNSMYELKPTTENCPESSSKSDVIEPLRSEHGSLFEAIRIPVGNSKVSELNWLVPDELINPNYVTSSHSSSIVRFRDKLLRTPWEVTRCSVTEEDSRTVVNILACLKVHTLLRKLRSAQRSPSPVRYWAANIQEKGMDVYLATEVDKPKSYFGLFGEKRREVRHEDYPTGVAAPELLVGNLCTDPKPLDSWAVGALIYGYLSGCQDFGEEPADAAMNIIRARSSPTEDEFSILFPKAAERSRITTDKLREALKMLFSEFLAVWEPSPEVNLPFRFEKQNAVEQRLHSVLPKLLQYNPKKRIPVEDALKLLLSESEEHCEPIDKRSLFNELLSQFDMKSSDKDTAENLQTASGSECPDLDSECPDLDSAEDLQMVSSSECPDLDSSGVSTTTSKDSINDVNEGFAPSSRPESLKIDNWINTIQDADDFEITEWAQKLKAKRGQKFAPMTPQ